MYCSFSINYQGDKIKLACHHNASLKQCNGNCSKNCKYKHECTTISDIPSDKCNEWIVINSVRCYLINHPKYLLNCSENKICTKFMCIAIHNNYNVMASSTDVRELIKSYKDKKPRNIIITTSPNSSNSSTPTLITPTSLLSTPSTISSAISSPQMSVHSTTSDLSFDTPLDTVDKSDDKLLSKDIQHKDKINKLHDASFISLDNVILPYIKRKHDEISEIVIELDKTQEDIKECEIELEKKRKVYTKMTENKLEIETKIKETEKLVEQFKVLLEN